MNHHVSPEYTWIKKILETLMPCSDLRLVGISVQIYSIKIIIIIIIINLCRQKQSCVTADFCYY